MKKEVVIGLMIAFAAGIYIFLNFGSSTDKKTMNKGESEQGMKEEVIIKEEVEENMEEKMTYTMEDVKSESNEGKCLIVINNKVYDMTDFPEDHPGGSDKILNNCGKDGTTVFETQGGKGEHSDEAVMKLEDFYIGYLSE